MEFLQPCSVSFSGCQAADFRCDCGLLVHKTTMELGDGEEDQGKSKCKKCTVLTESQPFFLNKSLNSLRLSFQHSERVDSDKFLPVFLLLLQRRKLPEVFISVFADALHLLLLSCNLAQNCFISL